MNEPILTSRDARGVARIVLNRPDVHNALNEHVIAAFSKAIDAIAADPAVRLVVLAGAGKSFCAGGDLAWMRKTAEYGFEQNIADANKLADMLHWLNTCPKPVLALVQGSVFGGGVGVVSCCDIVIAAEDVRFSLSEVRLGLIPATISPYVVRKLGESAARRYFLTAEVFGAAEAKRLGLAHEIVPADGLEAAGEKMIATLLQGGPRAQGESKSLIFRVADPPIDSAMRADTARRIAEARASAEGKEGAQAFLEKRKPSWRAG